MIRHRLVLFAVAFAAALLFPIAAIGDLVARITEDWPVIADVRAQLERLAATFRLDPPARAYAGPATPALLRHEAGMHRLGAARGI